MTATTTADVLSRAIQALERQGHGRGADLNNTTGQLCLNGALLAGAGQQMQFADGLWFYTPSPAFDEPAYDRAVAAAAVSVQIPHDRRLTLALHQVTYWNDYVCDGGEEAILLLKQALHALEEEATP